MKFKYITLVLPFLLTLMILADLGKEHQYVTSGEHIATAIIVYFGTWLLGYLTNYNDKIED